MGRTQPRLPDTDAGHEERLKRIQRRTLAVLCAPLAQDPEVVTIGTRITVGVDSRDGFQQPSVLCAPDPVQLAYLAMLARPFTLEREEIHFRRIASSLKHFAATAPQQAMTEQLLHLWGRVPVTRAYMYAAKAGEELLPGGAMDGQVADRVLYSQLVHADDASALLDHVEAPFQQWSLAGMVGDWVAIIAHQQAVLKLVRGDLCPELATWPGTPTTIFERWGLHVQETNTGNDQ
jgi:hypothetical protein